MSAKPTLSVAPNGNILISIPMTMRRKLGRKMILTPQALDGVTQNQPAKETDPVLQSLARAYCWTEIIESGQVRSISELARKLNVDGSYVTRVMKLSTLAPDIVQAVINGEEPDGLSQTKLFQPFPEDWVEQRKHFGFS